jgi:hypothetical protein
MTPPRPWHINRLCQDSRNPHHRGTRAQPVPLHDRLYEFSTAHLINSAYKHNFPVDPTYLSIPSDLSNWLIDNGAPVHMMPCLEDLVHVEKGPDVPIYVDDGTMVLCQGKCTVLKKTMDDDGHPLILKLPKVIYAPELTK